MRKDILGVVKLGQLKRIQSVVHRNWKLENQFEDRDWKEEISFILRGRGQLIPVNLLVDFLDNDLIELLNREAIRSNIKECSIDVKNKIERILKLLVLQLGNHILSNPK
ncbi:hypothetical protein [Parasediminibacterium sp. JCM 36343]|uniref:hypothetical protein n=1 Tax=Parasediminibacterium sp. JCM 36343 TaxID=3374279 RepID=UPI00397B1C8A